MALIVENGSGVPNANSYVTVEEAREYAEARGYTVGDDDAVTVLAIKAMDYLALFTEKWKGVRVFAEPALPFPRMQTAYSIDAIPSNLKLAQMQLVVEQLADPTLLLTPSTNYRQGFVVREKLDVIETQYSEAVQLAALGRASSGPTMPLVAALLDPLLARRGFGLTTQRV